MGDHVCGINGCDYSTPYAHVIGNHRYYTHGIRGSSRRAVARRETLAAQLEADREAPPWAPWTADELRVLRAACQAWHDDMPGIIDFSRRRLFEALRRDKSVQRVLREHRLLEAERATA